MFQFKTVTVTRTVKNYRVRERTEAGENREGSYRNLRVVGFVLFCFVSDIGYNVMRDQI